MFGQPGSFGTVGNNIWRRVYDPKTQAILGYLPEPARTLVREELAVREFVPTISKIVKVSSFSTPSTWQVSTDRGPTSFVLRSEDDIRRLEGQALLILSGHGVCFGVRDRFALDAHSRRLLDRFL